MRKRKLILYGAAVCFAAIYGMNASWIAGPPGGEMSLLAHRGVHQTYHRAGLTNTTCTAERIDPPAHGYIENTLPSMQAAIEAGADMIELDIKLTSDGEIIVFHDAALDCRTEGTGRTHKRSLAELKALDIGYGYTADGGQTYPFRGEFIGAMPTFNEVLTAFPDTVFMVNLKHSKAEEGQAYLDYVEDKHWARLGLTASPKPAALIKAARPEMIIQSRQNIKACLKGYALTGWFGKVPAACENNYVAVPSNFRHFIWGWPHRFEKRLQKVGSRSMLLGPYAGHGSVGLDAPEQLDVVPKDYKGIIFTNKIEVVRPILKPE